MLPEYPKEYTGNQLYEAYLMGGSEVASTDCVSPMFFEEFMEAWKEAKGSFLISEPRKEGDFYRIAFGKVMLERAAERLQLRDVERQRDEARKELRTVRKAYPGGPADKGTDVDEEVMND